MILECPGEEWSSPLRHDMFCRKSICRKNGEELEVAGYFCVFCGEKAIEKEEWE